MEQADEMMDNWVDLGCGGLMMFEEVEELVVLCSCPDPLTGRCL